MANKKKIINRAVSFCIVALIFYFLGKNLFFNWEQIREYQFSLNYFYLAFSFIFFGIGFLSRGLIWKKIVDFLEPGNNLTYFEAIKIDVYSQFGKYLPGKVFSVVGMIYLARNKNISKKNLYLSVILDNIFIIIAGFIFSLFLISFFFTYNTVFLNFYLVGIVTIISGLIAIHPRIFHCLVRLIPVKKIKKESIDLDFYLSWFNKVKIIFYYFLNYFSLGFGFFCLINSITYLSWLNLLSIVGVYILAIILGLVAFFAPGGLGVREGVLVLFLQFYFPLNIAILISLWARIWTIVTELFLLMGVFFYNKLRGLPKD